MTIWAEIDGGNQTNGAIAASGNARITFSDSRYKRGFNGLEVCNLDTVDVSIRLNGESTNGKAFVVPAGTLAVIRPEEGRFYDFVVIVNLDTVNAATAGAITFRASKSEVRQA